MNIGALWIHTPWDKYGADAGWGMAWHHRLDITWRWSASLDYFWRKRGYSGNRPDHVRKWKWAYLKPSAFQTIWQKYPEPFLPIEGVKHKKWNWNPHGGFGFGWLGITFHYSYQPKWDRSFDAEAYRREENAKERAREIRQAFRDKQKSGIPLH